jgi:hypothetical protein
MLHRYIRTWFRTTVWCCYEINDQNASVRVYPLLDRVDVGSRRIVGFIKQHSTSRITSCISSVCRQVADETLQFAVHSGRWLLQAGLLQVHAAQMPIFSPAFSRIDLVVVPCFSISVAGTDEPAASALCDISRLPISRAAAQAPAHTDVRNTHALSFPYLQSRGCGRGAHAGSGSRMPCPPAHRATWLQPSIIGLSVCMRLVVWAAM